MNVEYILIVLGAILVSMTLHEAMHAYMGYFLGDDTAKAQGRLSLNPIRHIDPFLTIILPILLAISGAPIFGGAKPVPFNPHNVRYGEFGAALVAVAGPLTNLIIAFLAFGVGALGGLIVELPSGDIGIAPTLAGQIIQAMVFVNLGFFIFNMLPIPPLDGSRVLYALAPESVRRVMEGMEQYGLIVIFAIVLLGQSALGRVMDGSLTFILDVFRAIFQL